MSYHNLARVFHRLWLLFAGPLALSGLTGLLSHNVPFAIRVFLLATLAMAILSPLLTAVVLDHRDRPPR